MAQQTLSAQDIRTILTRAGFYLDRTKGSHEQWKGVVDGKTRLVTLDAKHAPFTPRSDLLKSMIRQSGLGKKKFYQYLDRRFAKQEAATAQPDERESTP